MSGVPRDRRDLFFFAAHQETETNGAEPLKAKTAAAEWLSTMDPETVALRFASMLEHPETGFAKFRETVLPVRGDDGVLDEEFASFYLGHLERIRENRGRVVDWWDELVEGSVPVTEYKVAEPAETGAVLSRDDITSRNKMLPFCDHLVKDAAPWLSGQIALMNETGQQVDEIVISPDLKIRDVIRLLDDAHSKNAETRRLIGSGAAGPKDILDNRELRRVLDNKPRVVRKRRPARAK